MILLSTIGDLYNKKFLIIISYIAIGVCYVLLALGGSVVMSGTWWYYIVFVLNGIGNSILFTLFIGTLADWFPLKRRGLIIGAWSTSKFFGNIAGIQLFTIFGSWE